LRHAVAAEDDKDRVYAFLGLLDDGHVSIEADYTLNTRAAFSDVARKVIASSESLTILGLIARAEREKSMDQDIPSWVPDWTQAAICETLCFRIAKTLFKAADDHIHNPLPDELHNELLVKGRIIDKVLAVDDDFFTSDDP
jgi:hypothetical protein